MNKVIYFDNNATTRVSPEVKEAMDLFLTELYGNPSSIHQFGGQVKKHLEEARAKVASLLGCQPEEIIFTSCGTESDSTAIYSALNAYPEKKHIVTTAVEHPAIYNLCRYLERQGYRVTYLSVDEEGQLDLEELEKAISPETAIVSIMWANNETGVIMPVEKAAAMAKEKGVLFHTDAVQAAGKIPINLKANQIDLLSISGHKLHAPKGVGVLYIRQGTKFVPFLRGGHQENGRRAGTENVPGIIALGKASELALKNLEKERSYVGQLRDRLEKGLIESIPNIKINGARAPRLPNTLSVSFEFVEGESILLLLSDYGICASTGSACSSGSLEPSHVLQAMKIPFTFAHGTIRFSLSIYNTEEEADYVLEVLPGVIKKLRDISPFSSANSAH
ncbi:MAG TPA: cysteine desulfurase NifS [Candidatus Saccharicenans sp.]|nr:cysteine desulfurase NifS [Candidatus Saccharicenans sp.]HQO76722.1 cysteine desulfurase NifS [Candidatus Saccharicenans sp.]